MGNFENEIGSYVENNDLINCIELNKQLANGTITPTEYENKFNNNLMI